IQLSPWREALALAPPNQTVNPITITGGTMEIEALKAMNEGMYPSLLMVIEIIALINVIIAIAGFVIYLAGIAWLCFKEIRQPARHQRKPASAPPEPDEYDLSAVLAVLDDSPGDNLTCGVARPAPGVTTDFIGINETLQDKYRDVAASVRS